MNNNADRYVTTIYCDDIRHEVGNKMSLMGCYQGELHVQFVPSALPKLCAFVTVSTPKERPFKALLIRVMQDEVELGRMELPEAGVKAASQNHDNTSTRVNVNTALLFTPFVIEKPTTLRVLAVTEEGEMIGPRLSIKVLATQENPGQIEPKKKPAAIRPSRKKPSSRREKSAPAIL